MKNYTFITKALLLFFLFVIFTNLVNAQNDKTSYKEEFAEHIKKYKRELIRDLHSPLTAYDANFLNFYEPDSTYKVECKVTYLKNQDFFDFGTSSGTKRKYRKFTLLECPIQDTIITLYTYESQRLLNSEKYKDYIFLPFTDYTSGETTYGGGRYLDLMRDDFNENSVTIDFNNCYNPYCAYSTGYSCAIPPRENYIEIEIKAGEKIYKGEKKHRHKK